MLWRAKDQFVHLKPHGYWPRDVAYAPAGYDPAQPVLDGYEATRRIRADPELQAIPIIVVTSYALSGDDAKAKAARCDAHVAKPFSPRELLATIRKFLAAA